MKLCHYFKPRHAPGFTDIDKDPLFKELAELARGTAREGHVTMVYMHTPPLTPRCLCCSGKVGLCPMRIPVGGRQVTALLCRTCQRRISEPKMLSQMIYEVRRGVKQASPAMESAILTRHGDRIRIVWGKQIESEVLS